MNDEQSPTEPKPVIPVQTQEHLNTPRNPVKAPIGIRLFRGFLLSLALLLVAAVVLAATLVFVDLGQRRRIAREQASLSDSGTYLTVNSTLVHFRQSDPVPDPLALVKPQPPLVLIHGLMGSSMDFEYVQPELAKDRTVIAIDLIGFGLSDQSISLNYSKKAMADTISGLMELLDYNRYDVLGHSMGGEVALHLALSNKEQVGRLVLLDSAGLMTAGMPGTEGPGRTASASPFLIDLVFKNTFIEKAVFRSCLYDPEPFMPLAFEKLYYFVEQIPPQTLARFIEDNDSGAVADRLGEISQPTNIIWGEQDRIIPLSQGEALKEAIPGSRLDIIAKCGHLPYLEQPEELVRLIRAFLAG